MIRCFAVSALLALLSATPVLAAEAVAERSNSKPIQLRWDVSPGASILGYVVRVGTVSGVYTETYDVGMLNVFTFENGLAGRRYFFAVRAYAAGALSGPLSSEVSAVAAPASSPAPVRPPPVVVPPPVVPPPPPPPPVPVIPGEDEDAAPGIVLEPVVVRGTEARFRWALVGNLNATEYLIEVGSRSGASDLSNTSVGAGRSAAIAIEAGRTYHVRVRARTSPTTTLTSNEVVYSGDAPKCSKVPATPTRLEGSVTSGRVSLTWVKASGASSYVVQVGSESGLSDLFRRDVGTTTTVTSRVGGSATAYARVVAVNACGTSAASIEVVLQ